MNPRQDFGGELSYGNMADGWAKITKFNVDSSLKRGKLPLKICLQFVVQSGSKFIP